MVGNQRTCHACFDHFGCIFGATKANGVGFELYGHSVLACFEDDVWKGLIECRFASGNIEAADTSFVEFVQPYEGVFLGRVGPASALPAKPTVLVTAETKPQGTGPALDAQGDLPQCEIVNSYKGHIALRCFSESREASFFFIRGLRQVSVKLIHKGSELSDSSRVSSICEAAISSAETSDFRPEAFSILGLVQWEYFKGERFLLGDEDIEQYAPGDVFVVGGVHARFCRSIVFEAE